MSTGHRVHALTACPHLPAAFAPALAAAAAAAACAACASTSESWVCLTCAATGCSRHVAGHCGAHAAAAAHPVAISLSDMSVWCYQCDGGPGAYLDAFTIRALHAPFRAVYVTRFGEEPSLPQADKGASAAPAGGGGGSGSSGQ